LEIREKNIGGFFIMNKEKEEEGKKEDLTKKEQKKPVFIAGILLAVLIAIGLIVGIIWLFNYYSFISTDDSAIEGNKVSVSSKIMGRVKNLLVDEGAKVQEGQLLVELDDTDILAQKAQSEASLKLSEENMNLSKVNLDKTQRDFERTKSLFNSGATTKEQYDHAEDSLKTAKVQYSISEAQMNISRSQLDVLNTQLANTRIQSPTVGVISKKSIMQGEIAQPSQSIFTITDLKNIWITANFEETKIRLVSLNQPVEINVDAYPGYKFKGHVSQIGSAIVPPPFSIGETTKTTQKIPIKVLFNDIPESKILLPGMSVEVKIKVR
jgi:membrane fusion protein, multidrug efflux system